MNSFFESLIQPERKKNKKRRIKACSINFISGKYDIVGGWIHTHKGSNPWWHLFSKDEHGIGSSSGFHTKTEFNLDLLRYNFRGRNLIMRLENNTILEIGILFRK
jgi:hypothetical protein